MTRMVSDSSIDDILGQFLSVGRSGGGGKSSLISPASGISNKNVANFKPGASGDSGGEDEADGICAKRRTIVDSGRQPSLPTNQYNLGHPGAGPSSRSDLEAFGSDSEPSDIDFDPGSESGVIDTDFELEGIVPDNASQHTFGPEQYIAGPNEHRQEADSPVSFAFDEDDDSDMLESGSRGLGAIQHGSMAIRMASTRDRANSDIVPARSNAHQRDCTAPLRHQSYNNTEGDAFVNPTSSNRDQQPPLPPANWTMFANNAGISSTEGERVYKAWIDYIINADDSEGWNPRRHSSLPFIAPQSLPLPPPKDKRQPRDKEKVKVKDFDVAALRRLIGTGNSSSTLDRDVAPWEDADDTAGPRRPSTVSLDDSFAGGLLRDDPDYSWLRWEWTFIRERERISFSPREPAGNPRHWDVWRCSHIGRIRIERAFVLPSDPNKPNKDRLKAEHDADPDSANTLGGPTTLIHRHSRALAFSIYRRYGPHRSSRAFKNTATMGANSPRPSATSTIVAPTTYDGILLAAKRVQEQFTAMKRAKKLDNDRGLLPEDGRNRGDARREPDLSQPRRSLQDWLASTSQREPPTTRHIVDLSKLEWLDSPTSSTRVDTPSSHISSSSLDLPDRTASSSLALTPRDDEVNQHSNDKSRKSVSPTTSHAEAFATSAIDQLKDEQVPAIARRRSHGWIPRLIGPPRGITPPSLSSSVAPISPPRLTPAPRFIQEQGRPIKDLMSSFKDVGLVPSTRSKSGAGVSRKKDKNKDVLAQVPDDSPYMILPLWPHETDPTSAAGEWTPTPGVLNREQNLYLLVYYVPFDKQGEGNPTEYPSRSHSRKGVQERQHPAPQFDVRRGFKVIGRLIAHSDLNGADIRLPIRGLSVTGSLAEAQLGIPPAAALRNANSDDLVIGTCLDRNGTNIEFFPKGLEKLGLCVPRTEPHAQLHTHPGTEIVEPVDGVMGFQPLTAIGRAAVEVAWLGCMALMTFLGPQSQGPT